MHRVSLALVFSLLVNGRGVAGQPPPSFAGRWYVWNFTQGDVYAPGRVLFASLRNPNVGLPVWDVASEEVIGLIAETAKADPLLQQPEGPLRYWLFLNEPDLVGQGDWRDDAWMAGYWYARAYHAVKDNDPYNKARVGGPNLFDIRGEHIWLADFMRALAWFDAKLDVYALHDWWGRYEDYFVDPSIQTWRGVDEHIAWARSVGIITDDMHIWITETGTLHAWDQAESLQAFWALMRWEGRDQIDEMFWFHCPGWPSGGLLWDKAGQVTAVGRLWFSYQ